MDNISREQYIKELIENIPKNLTLYGFHSQGRCRVDDTLSEEDMKLLINQDNVRLRLYFGRYGCERVVPFCAAKYYCKGMAGHFVTDMKLQIARELFEF